MELANLKKKETSRLFIALPVPAAVKEGIKETQRELQKLLARSAVGWTRPEQIHLTLRFFGNVPADELEPLKTAFQNACADTRAFQITAAALGVFPTKRNPRIIWVGVQEQSGVLAALRARISSATVNFGQPPEDRAFSPHLTIGRIKQLHSGEAKKLRDVIANRGSKETQSWVVRAAELVRSDLGAAGAKYIVLRRCILGDGHGLD